MDTFTNARLLLRKYWLKPPVSFWVWLFLLTAIAFVLCMIPLFQNVGYESSLVLAVVGGMAGFGLAIACVRQWRQQSLALSVGVALQFCMLRALAYNFVCLLVPVVVLLVNSIRVKNCNYFEGFSFFFWISVLSSVCGLVWGVFVGLCFRKRWVSLLVGCLGWIGISLVWTGWRFLATPALFSYDPFFGYYPGSIYEEIVTLRPAFFWARWIHGCGVATLLALVLASYDPSVLRLRMERFIRSGRLRGIVVLCGVVWMGGFVAGQWLGVRSDHHLLQHHLPLVRETSHFTIHYPPKSSIAEDIDHWARECEFRYQEIKTMWGVEPGDASASRLHGWMQKLAPQGSPKKIKVYLFANQEDSQRFVGITQSLVTKAWNQEVYLVGIPWNHSVIKHELTHLFLEKSILSLNPGLFEGAAMASEWAGGEYSLAQEAKMMRKTHLEPPLRQVFGLAFWTLPAHRAYVLSGALIRYTWERFGRDRCLQLAFSSGRPADFERIFGIPFDQLVGDFYGWVDQQPLPPKTPNRPSEALARKDLFHKVCAHDIAKRTRRVWQHVRQEDWQQALEELDSICRDDPQNLEHKWERVEILWERGDFLSSQSQAEALLPLLQKEAHPLEGALLERLGDLSILVGHNAVAMRYYQEALALAFSTSKRRFLFAKQEALKSNQIKLLDFLIRPERDRQGRRIPRDGVRDWFLLSQDCALESSNGLCSYFLGARLLEERAYEEADQVLGQALRRTLPDDSLVEYALFLRAKAAFLRGAFQSAAGLFEQLVQRMPVYAQGKRLFYTDWLARAAWQANH